MQINKTSHSMLEDITSIVDELDKTYAQSPYKDDRIGNLIEQLKQTIDDANSCSDTGMVREILYPVTVILDPVTAVLGRSRTRNVKSIHSLRMLSNKLDELKTLDIVTLRVNTLGKRSAFRIQKIKNERNHGRKEDRNIKSFK